MDIILIRHGNNFNPGDVVLRMGGRTDLPLATSGELQAKALARHLSQAYPAATAIYTSPLQRTMQTAQAIADTYLPAVIPIYNDLRLKELDYGIDEGQPESQVVERIGAAALRAWEEQAMIPPGWAIDKAAIKQNWQELLADLNRDHAKTAIIMIVSSQGILRFLPELLGLEVVGSKMLTGSYSHLAELGGKWEVKSWNQRPQTSAVLES